MSVFPSLTVLSRRKMHSRGGNVADAADEDPLQSRSAEALMRGVG